MANPARPEPGRIIDRRYRLDALRGRGAMGEVWQATHLSLGSPLAIKLIDPSLIGDNDAERRELLLRFEREARAAAALQSPHVVRVTDHGMDGDTPYMAMELLVGESLGDRLERLGRLAPSEVVRIVTHVARGIGRAHELGIVHRDLKPDNIFLASGDDGDVAKVLDFGIAKLVRSPLDISGRATGTGRLIGTPCYMSPEQASGSDLIDHRTDLWSLAVIAFECLTGRLPFDSNNVGDMVLSICTRRIPVPSEVDPDLPPAFDSWWAHAASRDASQRFPDAKSMADALRQVFADHAGVPSSIEGALPRPKPPEPARPAVAQTSHEGVTLRAPRKKKPGPIVALGVGLGAVAGVAAWFVSRSPAPVDSPAAQVALGGASSAAPAGTSVRAPEVAVVAPAAPAAHSAEEARPATSVSPSTAAPPTSARPAPVAPKRGTAPPPPAPAPSPTPDPPPPAQAPDPRLGI